MTQKHPERVPLHEVAAILGVPERHIERFGYYYGLEVRGFGRSRWVHRGYVYELLKRRKELNGSHQTA